MARNAGLFGLRSHTEEGDTGTQAAIALAPTPMTTTPMTTTPMTQAAACEVYSWVTRDGLAIYDLKPQEFWLAHLLVLESYDRRDAAGRPARVPWGKLSLEDWAARGGFRDNKGTRCDKLRPVLESLAQLGIVDVNWIEGTFELRPSVESWSRVNGLRAKPRPVQTAQQVMELCAERPLSAAMAEVSREKALEGVGVAAGDSNPVPSGPSHDHLARASQTHGRSIPWGRLTAALSDPDEMARLQTEFGPQSADFSADVGEFRRRDSAEKSADTELPTKQGVNASAEKSAETHIVSLALGTKAKLAISAEKSAETRATPEAALEWLRKVDRRSTLEGRFADGYFALCNRKPDYVLGRLRSCFEEHERYYKTQRGEDFQLSDPVGWMGRKAADEWLMKWHGKR